MSVLTEALERILKCLEQKAPEIASSFQPGLNREVIDEKTKDLPCPLPEEVYELYQWRNGLSENIGFDMAGHNGITGGFYSLEIAFKEFQHLKNSGCPSNLFPVFGCSHQFGLDFFAVVLGKDPSPVVHYDDEIGVKYLTDRYVKKCTLYPTLTNLIYTIAGCCKEAFSRITYPNGYSCPYVDKKKFKQIHHRYSSGNLRIYKL